MNKDFVKSVEKACDRALVERGFERPRAGTRFIRLDDGFLGWVGLNRGNYSDYLQLNPFIGIHCVPIMKLKKDFAEERYKEGYIATYGIHMGEIAPEIRQFIFMEDTDIQAEAERLADEIVTHALPWMEAHANYEALLPLLKSRIDMLGGWPESYTLALYFSGQRDEAKQFVLERTDLFNSEYDESYSIYEKFGKPFLEMLEEEEGQNRC